MKSLKPMHGAILILLLAGSVMAGSYFLEGGFLRSSYEKVLADEQGLVSLDIADLEAEQVRFFRFINVGNQEVDFFVGRDKNGHVHVAFDANEICYKLKRGYRHQGEWVVCNKCDKSFRLTEINAGGGGCKPVPLAHQLRDDQVILRENDILTGWRYFR